MKFRSTMIALALTSAAVAGRAFAQAPDGKALYDENCKKCHGAVGKAPKTMQAKFPKIATFDAAFVAARSDDSVVKVLTKGKNEDMVSFKDKMKPAEMLAVAKYVRELGSKGKP
jgi:mono/diheme cytochrome c family protein